MNTQIAPIVLFQRQRFVTALAAPEACKDLKAAAPPPNKTPQAWHKALKTPKLLSGTLIHYLTSILMPMLLADTLNAWVLERMAHDYKGRKDSIKLVLVLWGSRMR